MPKGFKGFQKGHTINLGKERTEITKLRISKALTGKKLSKKHRENIGLAQQGENHWMYGKHQPQSVRDKISKAHMGKIISKETRRRLSIALSGENHPNFGKKLSKETKKRISESEKGKIVSTETRGRLSFANSGEKHARWKGGISFLPYGPDLTKALKEEIRKRDNYQCQLCEISQANLSGYHKKLSIHHIDGDKWNNAKWNLISLCHKCHGKMDARPWYWKNYFYEGIFTSNQSWDYALVPRQCDSLQ